MGKNLYEDIKYAEHISKSRKNKDRKVAPPVIRSETDLSTEEIDIKNILESYRYNPIQKDSMDGNKSIEHVATDLSQYRSMGIDLLLPRKESKPYNAKISQLEKLIDVPPFMKTRGFFFPDNPLTATAWSFALYGIYSFARAIYTDLPEIPLAAKVLVPSIGAATAFAIRAINPSIEQAKYIDDKNRQYFET